MIYVKTEAERTTEAINYAKSIVEEIEREIIGCDYIENVDGKLEFCPNAYAEERRQLSNEKYKWEKMLQLLTMEAPFSMITW